MGWQERVWPADLLLSIFKHSCHRSYRIRVKRRVGKSEEWEIPFRVSVCATLEMQLPCQKKKCIDESYILKNAKCEHDCFPPKWEFEICHPQTFQENMKFECLCFLREESISLKYRLQTQTAWVGLPVLLLTGQITQLLGVSFFPSLKGIIAVPTSRNCED